MSGRSRASGARSSVSSHPTRNDGASGRTLRLRRRACSGATRALGRACAARCAGSARAVASSARRAYGTTCGRPRRPLADRARASAGFVRGTRARLRAATSHRSRLGGRKPRPEPRCCGRFCDERSPGASTCRQSQRSGLGGRKPRPGPRCCGRFCNEAVPRPLFPPRRSTLRPRRRRSSIPLELHAATRQVGASRSPAGEPRSRPTPNRRDGADAYSPVPALAGQPERSPRPTEVVEFEAPAQRLAARVEREASPDRQIRAGVPRQSAENALRAELAVDEDQHPSACGSGPCLLRRRDASRTSNACGSRQSPSGFATRSRPLSPIRPLVVAPSRSLRVDRHPWPELPPSLDQVDSDVEAALRAWDHQRRLDHEQTRL